MEIRKITELDEKESEYYEGLIGEFRTVPAGSVFEGREGEEKRLFIVLGASGRRTKGMRVLVCLKDYEVIGEWDDDHADSRRVVEELSGMKLRLVGLVADEFSAEERDADGSIEDRR